VVRDNGVAARLSRSLGNPAALRATLRAGAVRGMGRAGGANPPVPATIWPDTIWLADVVAGGNVCVPKGSNAFLWRSDTAAARSGSLATSDDRLKVNVQWPAQASGAVWPADALPLADGASYRFTDDGPVSRSVAFRIVAIDPAKLPADAAGIGTLLLDKGCIAQFDWLASSLERLGEAPPKAGG
jgi:hypothetical protein